MRCLARTSALLLIAVLLGCPTHSTPLEGADGPPLRVLFLGNSYTLGLADTISEIARAQNRPAELRSIARAGWTLRRHSESPATLDAIRAGDWDYVVLQEQSQIPSFPQARRDTDVVPFVRTLCDEAHESGAEVLLFLTWSRRDGDRRNVPGDTYAAMQSRLVEGYEQMADACPARIVPVGLAWQSALTDPDLDLFHPDGSHPSRQGLLLNALVFYRFMFRESPGELSSAGLPREIQGRLHGVAEDVVPDERLPLVQPPRERRVEPGLPDTLSP